jgi:hypothetical protein
MAAELEPPVWLLRRVNTTGGRAEPWPRPSAYASVWSGAVQEVSGVLPRSGPVLPQSGWVKPRRALWNRSDVAESVDAALQTD